MNAIAALALGINQIKLSNREIPGQGIWQSDEDNCEERDNAYLNYSCAERMNLDPSENFNAGDDCNVKWNCLDGTNSEGIQDYSPYSFMQWLGKNIGTTNLTAPEAYCSLLSSGKK